MGSTHYVSDIPMNDFSLTRGIGAVAVADQVFLFGFNKSGDADAVQVLAFNPAINSWRALQPPERGDGITEDVPALEGEETVIHFAVASEEKVYMFVGGRGNLNAHTIKVFDTRSLRWSCVKTSGDVPSEIGRLGVRACEYNGQVYMCHVELVRGSSLWALDLSSLRWTIAGTWNEGTYAAHHAACLLPFKNRLYMLLDELTGERACEDYVILYFDLATHKWEEPYSFGSEPVFRRCWISFILQEKLYILLREKPSYLLFRFGTEKVNQTGMKYSFATNRWVGVIFRGITSADPLDLVCIVHNMAVFFCFEKQKAYVHDFFPSLRRLCFQAISKYHLDLSSLPKRLQIELALFRYP